MSVHLTPAALERVKQFLQSRPDSAGVRFAIKRTGCSGYGYVVDLAETAAADDTVVEQDGVRMLIDPQALPLIAGTEIDFVRQGLNQTFVFRNPNATGECGCGESFTTS